MSRQRGVEQGQAHRVGFSWGVLDQHRTWTSMTLVGVPLAGLLAVYGLPPVDIHGPFHYLGLMAPTCGITRGVMWFLRGDFMRAWMFNPASLLVVPAIVVLITRAVYGYATGRWLTISVRWRPWLWLVPALLILLLAIRQQLNAELLIGSPAG